MRRILCLFVVCFLTICAYSQEHIKFNGATFGKPLTEFVKGFPAPISEANSYWLKGYNPNLCNRKCYNIKLNSETWYCNVFSSRKSNIVFRAISVCPVYQDLENHLMLLVKALEEKYGGGVEEKQENLGEVSSLSNGDSYKEMLALYYYVKGRNNQRIGEIRISCAPWGKEAKSGYIELSYSDYNAQKIATNEYNSLMRDAL